jgi:L-alanine-DL-glutamate epimerase-like enolase superfamily enzyme
MAEELAGHIQAGYQFVKVGFGKKGHANLGVDEVRDLAFVKTVRAAIGEEAGFIVDVGAKCRWDLPRAIRSAAAMSEYRLTWLEDPFHPDNLSAYQRLRAAVPQMKIAFGERFFNQYDYQRLLEAQSCDVILVDPGRAEGITGMWKIIQLAALHNVALDAHSWSSAINTAASLHLSLCAPLPTLFELKPTPSSIQHELVSNPVEQEAGWVYAPQGYGLGADVREETVQRLVVKFN